jgi:hypothetical protein
LNRPRRVWKPDSRPTALDDPGRTVVVGNSGTAQVGTVASALRYLARSVMTGVSGEITRNPDD